MPSEFKLRVYFEDTDAAGVVYYGNYLKFMERARSQWFLDSSCGMRNLMQTHQMVFVVSRTELNYKRSAKLEDELVILTEIQTLKKASIVFEQKVFRDQELLCDGLTKVGCISTINHRPTLMPNDVYQDLQALIRQQL